jgi:hypothetical protein
MKDNPKEYFQLLSCDELKYFVQLNQYSNIWNYTQRKKHYWGYWNCVTYFNQSDQVLNESIWGKLQQEWGRAK